MKNAGPKNAGVATEAWKAQAGKGRPKGVPNKATAAIKDMLREALDMAGGVNYLLTQATENPTAFMSLIGRIIPQEVAASIEHKVASPDPLMTAPVWQSQFAPSDEKPTLQ